ncbi:MAG: deoxyribodipyrimidine photo-lyase [Caldilineaceae bacterium]
MSTSIWWIRRDLRLSDAPALQAALQAADQTLPVFILDPKLLHSSYVGEKRTAFLFDGLRALDQDLRQVGSHLIICSGDPATELTTLCGEHNVTAIYAEADVSPYARQRDERVAQALGERLRFTSGLTIRPLDAALKKDGTPYTVYGHYNTKWKSLGVIHASALLAAPIHITTPPDVKGLPLPEQPTQATSTFFPAGERVAQKRLTDFVTGDNAPVFGYANNRNRPALDGTSQLSAYLRFGMLSLRSATQAAYAALERAANQTARASVEVWLDELIWREFYLTILHYFPHVRTGNYHAQFDGIQWLNDADDFAAWCEGRTGYPIVDAAMRQMKTTGWMHNRARMIVASFLVKDLLIDWRWGERWFMQQLIDGDPAANNGGWQWSAGVGPNAAPYFRVFQPVTQGEKFDPDGVYIRRWVPELTHVPKKFIHQPWLMSKSEQLRARCEIGKEYPAPIVDHAFARERVLAAYRAARMPVPEE